MKKILVVVVLAIGLSSCANITNAWNTLTGARVSPQAVYVAQNVEIGFERTATNYLRGCHQHPGAAICSKTAEVAVANAVRSARSSARDLRVFMKSHPDALGASGLYDALKSATGTLKDVLTAYGVIQ